MQVLILYTERHISEGFPIIVVVVDIIMLIIMMIAFCGEACVAMKLMMDPQWLWICVAKYGHDQSACLPA